MEQIKGLLFVDIVIRHLNFFLNLSVSSEAWKPLSALLTLRCNVKKNAEKNVEQSKFLENT